MIRRRHLIAPSLFFHLQFDRVDIIIHFSTELRFWGFLLNLNITKAPLKVLRQARLGWGQVSALLSDWMCKLWSPITCWYVRCKGQITELYRQGNVKPSWMSETASNAASLRCPVCTRPHAAGRRLRGRPAEAARWPRLPWGRGWRGRSGSSAGTWTGPVSTTYCSRATQST